MGLSAANGQVFQVDDIITMLLDIKNKKISFKHNGTDLENIRFKSKGNTKFGMVMSLYGSGACVQILQYQER